MKGHHDVSLCYMSMSMMATCTNMKTPRLYELVFTPLQPLASLLKTRSQHADSPSGFLVLVLWGRALLLLIDSLIRNEQQRLVLWVIVIFVTLRSELRQ